MIRTVVGGLIAGLYRLRFGKRIVAKSFIIVKPVRVRIAPGAQLEIGRGVVVEAGARVIVRGRLRIGDDVYIGKNVTIVAFESVDIGSRTLIGENVSIHDEDHGPAGDRDAFKVAPVRIGDDSWLCAGVVVTSGSSVGERSTVGANAVVTSNIPADCTAGGVPARVLKTAELGDVR